MMLRRDFSSLLLGLGASACSSGGSSTQPDAPPAAAAPQLPPPDRRYVFATIAPVAGDEGRELSPEGLELAEALANNLSDLAMSEIQYSRRPGGLATAQIVARKQGLVAIEFRGKDRERTAIHLVMSQAKNTLVIGAPGEVNHMMAKLHKHAHIPGEAPVFSERSSPKLHIFEYRAERLRVVTRTYYGV